MRIGQELTNQYKIDDFCFMLYTKARLNQAFTFNIIFDNINKLTQHKFSIRDITTVHGKSKKDMAVMYIELENKVRYCIDLAKDYNTDKKYNIKKFDKDTLSQMIYKIKHYTDNPLLERGNSDAIEGIKELLTSFKKVLKEIIIGQENRLSCPETYNKSELDFVNMKTSYLGKKIVFEAPAIKSIYNFEALTQTITVNDIFNSEYTIVYKMTGNGIYKLPICVTRYDVVSDEETFFSARTLKYHMGLNIIQEHLTNFNTELLNDKIVYKATLDAIRARVIETVNFTVDNSAKDSTNYRVIKSQGDLFI